MGLIKAALGAAGGVMADQWKEYFYCEALPAKVMMRKGQKRVSGRSSNTKGNDNIISNGSIIAVADGQCMMIVEQGKIVDICAEPGEYTYDTSTEPSIFTGNLGDGIKALFQTMGKRFTFGGEAPKDQRIYYFNTKEMVGNKFGTPTPVPFRVVDERAAIDIDISIRCFGTYSYRMTNPMLFYASLAGNVGEEYVFGGELEQQMKSEFLDKLQPAFARISEMGIRYSALPGRTTEISTAMKELLTPEWSEGRGLEVVKVAISSVTANEEDEKMIKEMQRETAYMDPRRAMAYSVTAQGEAAKIAAGNTAGAMTGFMGMGMAQGVGGNTVQALAGMAQQQQQMEAQQQAQQMANQMAQQMQQAAQEVAASAPTGWKCACGAVATGKFCPECGAKKPEPPAGWKCACGATATGKFCPECGSPKPVAEGWTCACGAVNKGKFCPECGAKKPAGVPQYKCDKCEWEPEKGTTPPKFCPECGDPFDDGDIA